MNVLRQIFGTHYRDRLMAIVQAAAAKWIATHPQVQSVPAFEAYADPIVENELVQIEKGLPFYFQPLAGLLNGFAVSFVNSLIAHNFAGIMKALQGQTTSVTIVPVGTPPATATS